MGATPTDQIVQILDGPVGTELLRRGVPTPLPGWSAHALESQPDVVEAIHRDYRAAGAMIHTTNTFRTRARVFPRTWEQLGRVAVDAARAAAAPGQFVAGSLAPLEDCYRPDLSPAHSDPDACRQEHADLARVLADAGCDLLLCETFPLVHEGLLAAEAALATGLETWVAFTPGPEGDLLTPAEVAEGARAALSLGVAGVLVNCVPATAALAHVRALADVLATSRTRWGCYANAGHADEQMGWSSAPGIPDRYADLARTWVDAGATIIGGCCGTGPEHVAALARRFGR
ncbi:MAG: S-methylmethionine-dependent homocysteine/selenocysteine methylase [Chlamydiales bacterium]|jgi:S-methylmethionine-dependent homocysteine/selenocysteine methylase